MIYNNYKKSYITYINILCFFIIISLIIWIICTQIKDYYNSKDPMLFKLKNMIIPLHSDIKNVKLYKGKKSYTLNKEKIYLCLYDENNKYYSENLLIYVLLHEISHYLNKDDIGHTEKFDNIFKDLLHNAGKLGIYNPLIPIDNAYCMHN